MRRTLAVLVVGLASVACGEEEPGPPPPMEPVIQSPNALCESVEQVFLLDSVQLRVKDLDGVEDLLDPVVVVGSTRLPVAVVETVPWDEAAAKAAAEASGEDPEECLSEQMPPTCEVVYRWERDPLDETSPEIFCGENGDLLEVEMEITDSFGFRKVGVVGTQPK